jgi:hypothetical protein
MCEGILLSALSPNPFTPQVHRDTGKEPGMFATLLLQLPCLGGHGGGQLTVTHGGASLVWDTAAVAGHAVGRGGGSTMRYCGFFADCEHVLSPVTTGVRCGGERTSN